MGYRNRTAFGADSTTEDDDTTSDDDDDDDDDVLVLDATSDDATSDDATSDDAELEPYRPTPPRPSMFQGECKLPDEVVMIILRHADYDLNLLPVCKDLRRLGTKDFADYWLGRIVHAEDTQLNDAETAPETSKRSKRWARGVSVKVETDGRSGAKRRVAATEFVLQRRVSSAGKRLNVHRLLELVMHGASTGHRGELCQAIFRACDNPTSKLHASMLTRFPYIMDVAYDRYAYIAGTFSDPDDTMHRALVAPSEEEREASRRTVRENYLRLVGCRCTEMPLQHWLMHADEGSVRRLYGGMSREGAIARLGETVEAAKVVIERLRPHVEAAVRAETIGGVRVFSTPEEVQAAVRNAGLDSWREIFARTPKPSRRGRMRLMLARYMDPNTRPGVVGMVGPVSFWHTSGLKSAGDLFNPASYAATYALDRGVRDHFSETSPCGGKAYFRAELAVANNDPSDVARHNLGRYSAGLYWDTSLLESLAGTFANGAFGGRIGHWNVSRVRTMHMMLLNNSTLDPRTLLEWNVQSVEHGDTPEQLVRNPP
jgi:hypothetical protein